MTEETNMYQETTVSSRPDREITKKIISPGNFNIVPFDDSRCRITVTDVTCTNEAGSCEMEPESRIFSKHFDGNVLIGDSDSFIDKDFELVLQQMCCGELCEAKMVYRDSDGVLVKEICCKIHLREVTEEQLISDWSWDRLYEASLHHKECGVQLIKEKRIADAFRRFNKALKMVVAMEPIDPDTVQEKVQDIIDLKVKLYNNLAHCQLQYNEYDAALQLCDRTLNYEPDNLKALYRRCIAHTGLHMYEEAWTDIQKVLHIEPNDKAAQQKANELKPRIEKINKDYTNVIKKMFV